MNNFNELNISYIELEKETQERKLKFPKFNLFSSVLNYSNEIMSSINSKSFSEKQEKIEYKLSMMTMKEIEPIDSKYADMIYSFLDNVDKVKNYKTR